MQPACRASIPSRMIENHAVTRTFARVAFEAQRLKVCQIIRAAVLSRKDMIHFDGSLV